MFHLVSDKEPYLGPAEADLVAPELLPLEGVDDQGEEEGGDGSNAVSNLAGNDAPVELSANGTGDVETHEAIDNDDDEVESHSNEDKHTIGAVSQTLQATLHNIILRLFYTTILIKCIVINLNCQFNNVFHYVQD